MSGCVVFGLLLAPRNNAVRERRTSRRVLGMPSMITSTRLVVSTRLPDTRNDADCALEFALREHGIWMGCAGRHDMPVESGRAMLHVLAEIIVECCEEVLRPLAHEDAALARVQARWNACFEVSKLFSQHALALATANASIWVADARLLLVGRALRQAGFWGRIGLYLDMAFPDVEIIERLDWGLELVRALLAFDRLGFDTQRSSDNFLAAAIGMRTAAASTDGAIASRYRITETEVSPEPVEVARRFFDGHDERYRHVVSRRR